MQMLAFGIRPGMLQSGKDEGIWALIVSTTHPLSLEFPKKPHRICMDSKQPHTHYVWLKIAVE